MLFAVGAAPSRERAKLSQDDRACAAPLCLAKPMGKKSRRARGGGRRGTPNSNSKVVSLTRHLLDDDEKIKRGYADGTLTINTLRTVEPTLRTAVARRWAWTRRASRRP